MRIVAHLTRKPIKICTPNLRQKGEAIRRSYFKSTSLADIALQLFNLSLEMSSVKIKMNSVVIEKEKRMSSCYKFLL